MAYERDPLIVKFGSELVGLVYNRVLKNELLMWAGGRPRTDRLHQRLEETGLTDRQRELVWRLIADAAENAYHAAVQHIDDEVTRGRLEIRFTGDGRAVEWNTETIGMPFGFSADMIEAYGVDPAKLPGDGGRLREAAARPADSSAEVAPDPRAAETEAFWQRIKAEAAAEGRCDECGRPPGALRRTCGTCGQAY